MTEVEVIGRPIITETNPNLIEMLGLNIESGVKKRSSLEEFVSIKERRNEIDLNEVVSDLLVEKGLLRLDPQIYGLKRKVVKELDYEKFGELKDELAYATTRRGSNMSMDYLHKNSSLVIEVEIPLFIYHSISGNGEIIFWGEEGILTFNREYQKIDEWRDKKLKLVSKFHEESRFLATYDLTISRPKVPVEVNIKGFEAASSFNKICRKIPKDIRARGNISMPEFGLIWIPSVDRLNFEIKQVKESVQDLERRLDPVIIMRIPGKERNYDHVVTAYNIGEEEPFQPFIDKYNRD